MYKRGGKGLADAFIEALNHGHAEIVRILFEDGRLEVWRVGENLLCLACEHGYIGMVKKLLADPRIPPQVDVERCALSAAVRCGSLELVQLLLQDDRIRPGAFRSEALAQAATHGHAEIVKVLLECPEVNEQDAFGGDDDDYLNCGGSFGVVNVLFRSGQLQPQRLFRHACEEGILEFVQLILGHTFVAPTPTPTPAAAHAGHSKANVSEDSNDGGGGGGGGGGGFVPGINLEDGLRSAINGDQEAEVSSCSRRSRR